MLSTLRNLALIHGGLGQGEMLGPVFLHFIAMRCHIKWGLRYCDRWGTVPLILDTNNFHYNTVLAAGDPFGFSSVPRHYIHDTRSFPWSGILSLSNCRFCQSSRRYLLNDRIQPQASLKDRQGRNGRSRCRAAVEELTVNCANDTSTTAVFCT